MQITMNKCWTISSNFICPPCVDVINRLLIARKANQQSRLEMQVLFTLPADRYECGSAMITINLPFSKWEQIFKDPTVTAAAIDRLVHHSVILELNIESYRIQVAAKNKSKKPDGPAKGAI
jgi:hypothetical protein